MNKQNASSPACRRRKRYTTFVATQVQKLPFYFFRSAHPLRHFSQARQTRLDSYLWFPFSFFFSFSGKVGMHFMGAPLLCNCRPIRDLSTSSLVRISLFKAAISKGERFFLSPHIRRNREVWQGHKFQPVYKDKTAISLFSFLACILVFFGLGVNDCKWSQECWSRNFFRNDRNAMNIKSRRLRVEWQKKRVELLSFLVSSWDPKKAPLEFEFRVLLSEHTTPGAQMCQVGKI